MGRKDVEMMIIVAFVAGLCGGLLSKYLFGVSPALAERAPQIPKSISAEEFRLVDATGKTRAIFQTKRMDWKDKLIEDADKPFELPGSHLTFFDEDGRKSASIGYFSGTGGSLSLLDNDKNTFQTLSASTVKIMAYPTSVALNVDEAGSSLGMFTGGGDQTSYLSIAVGNGSPPQGPLKRYEEQVPPVAAELAMGASRSSNDMKKVRVKPNRVGLSDTGSATLSLTMDGEPTLAFDDKKGATRAVLGKTELITPRTGTTETRSVSSLVLFGSDETVLWSTP